MPVDPARLNAVGDLVLKDPGELHALADQLRLTLFDLVRREGPLTSAALAERVDQDEMTIEGELRELESVGLVEAAADEGATRWRSDVKGIFFEIPDDPEGQLAARRLSNVMLAKYAELPFSWAHDEEPRLALEWARSAGLFNARVELTPAELRELQQELERWLEPFILREEKPEGAAHVRILAFFMPESPPEHRPAPRSL
jgi:hypothetical protein